MDNSFLLAMSRSPMFSRSKVAPKMAQLELRVNLIDFEEKKILQCRRFSYRAALLSGAKCRN